MQSLRVLEAVFEVGPILKRGEVALCVCQAAAPGVSGHTRVTQSAEQAALPPTLDRLVLPVVWRGPLFEAVFAHF